MKEEKFKNKYRIKSTRHPEWDYNDDGMYYVIICTDNKICYFGNIINEEMKLNNIGEIVNKFWLEIPEHFKNVELDEYIIMPNHIHGIIFICNDDIDEAVRDGRGRDVAPQRLYGGKYKFMNKKLFKNKLRQTKPEIMSPIRDWASLEACKNYADAVYFGLSELTMRANADVFTLRNLNSFVRKCHGYGIKAYLTVNSVLYNDDIKVAEKIIKKAKEVGVDAVIVWDPAAIEIARKFKMKFFISTQANISNWQTALFYKKLGASRVVLAREMTLKQISELSDRVGSALGGKKKVGDLEIETFVHGAMCWSISGRCLLSAAIYGKSANCGTCGQPCRKEWILEDDEGNKISTEGKYFMSAKDLCMIEHVPELIKAGIDSFKLEGRRRDPRYIETVSRCYRKAVDAYFDGSYTKEKVKQWKQELAGVYNREMSTGFFFGQPGPEGISYDKADNVATVKKTRAGIVTKYYPKIKVALVKLTDRGVKQGEEIVIEGAKTYLRQKIKSIGLDKQKVGSVSKGQEVGIAVEKRVKIGDNIFIIN